ncbi:hypothetical protein D3C85_1716210 [compost metagenome]
MSLTEFKLFFVILIVCFYEVVGRFIPRVLGGQDFEPLVLFGQIMQIADILEEARYISSGLVEQILHETGRVSQEILRPGQGFSCTQTETHENNKHDQSYQ